MKLLYVDELPNGDYIEYLTDGCSEYKVRYYLLKDSSTKTKTDKLYVMECLPF